MSKIPDSQLRAIRRTLPEVKTISTLDRIGNRHRLHTRPVDFADFVRRLEARLAPSDIDNSDKLRRMLAQMAENDKIPFTFEVESSHLIFSSEQSTGYLAPKF